MNKMICLLGVALLSTAIVQAQSNDGASVTPIISAPKPYTAASLAQTLKMQSSPALKTYDLAAINFSVVADAQAANDQDWGDRDRRDCNADPDGWNDGDHDRDTNDVGRSAGPTGYLLPAGYFHTKGSQIVDCKGRPVRLACVGYFDPGGLNGASITSDRSGMVAAGFNCLRYPWYDATWGGASNVVGSALQADQIVAAASAVGLKVILDHHGNEIPSAQNNYNPYPANGLWYDLGGASGDTDGWGEPGHYTNAQVVQDIANVAARYAGNSTVIGIGLQNEPHLSPSWWALNPGGSTWGNSAGGNGGATPGSDTDIRAFFITAGNAVQAVNSNVLIFAEGPVNQTNPAIAYNGQTMTVPGMTDLTGVPAYPVTLNTPNKVVYETHHYPVSIGGGGLDSGATFISGMNQTWGYLISGNTAPVFIGEMGGSLDGTDDSAGANLADEQAWASTMVSYLNGHAAGGPTFSGNQQGISTDWWAWGDLAGEYPDGTLLPNGTRNAQQYAVYSQLAF